MKGAVEAISIEQLRTLLRYEPETGRLFWLPRTAELFKNDPFPCAVGRCRQWNGRHAGVEALKGRASNGYLMGSIFGRNVLAHRVIWALVHGVWPVEIDHINGDRTDNRLGNLRNVSRARNARNCGYRLNSSGHTGVYLHRPRGLWRAVIHVNGKSVSLGYFKEKADAAAARKEAERKYGFHSNHGRVK